MHLAFGPIFGPEGSLLERVERFRAGPIGVDAEERGGPAGKITTHVVPHLVGEINPLADRACLCQPAGVD